MSSLLLFSETCRCFKRITTNYRVFTPYVGVPRSSANLSAGANNMTGIIPDFLNDLVVSCCASCSLHGSSFVDFNLNGKNAPAHQRDDKSLKAAIDHNTDLNFPIYGWKGMDTYSAYYRYTPLVESPGVAFIIMLGEDGAFRQITKALSEVLPFGLLCVVLALLAGIIVWFLVSLITDNKARLVMKMASFFVICFGFLFILLVGLDRALNTKVFEMQMNN